MAVLTFEGGLNEQDVSQVAPSECIAGYNFELGSRNTHLQPRNPFDLLGTSTNVGDIRGFVQLIKNDDSETTLVQSGDTLYQWDGTTGFTSRGTVNASSQLRGVTWELDGYSVITDLQKLTVIKKWDGSSLTTLTTGLGNDLYAKYGIVYLGRVWLFNVKSGTDTPHLMVASEFEDPTSYDTAKRAKDSSFSTGNEAFYMVTPDLKPINGVALFYNTLIVSTSKGQLWKLTGSTSEDFAWEPFYAGSAAIGVETMSNIGDDILYMRKDGVIESLRSTQTYGDTKTDDLSRWIPTTVDGLTDAITIYDQTTQKIYLFTTANKLLVLFKDMLATDISPWSIYRTSHDASFVTSAAIYMRRPGASNYYVYWGDTMGHIFQMEGTGNGDPTDLDIETYRQTKFFEELEMESGEPFNPETDILSGRIYYRRVANCDLLMGVEWADDYSVPSCTIPLKGPSVNDGAVYFGGNSYYGGLFYFNTGFQFAQRMSTTGFSSVGRGPGFNLSLAIQSTQKFDIAKIEM